MLNFRGVCKIPKTEGALEVSLKDLAAKTIKSNVEAIHLSSFFGVDFKEGILPYDSMNME